MQGRQKVPGSLVEMHNWSPPTWALSPAPACPFPSLSGLSSPCSCSISVHAIREPLASKTTWPWGETCGGRQRGWKQEEKRTSGTLKPSVFDVIELLNEGYLWHLLHIGHTPDAHTLDSGNSFLLRRSFTLEIWARQPQREGHEQSPNLIGH